MVKNRNIKICILKGKILVLNSIRVFTYKLFFFKWTRVTLWKGFQWVRVLFWYIIIR